mmetsp:Transcript_36893/g.90424  ORF Transcript_36893/g.90424 Transcript_36893/m.90424 type:complete len:175 (-) Transcript_36893:22-546(-)
MALFEVQIDGRQVLRVTEASSERLRSCIFELTLQHDRFAAVQLQAQSQSLFKGSLKSDELEGFRVLIQGENGLCGDLTPRKHCRGLLCRGDAFCRRAWFLCPHNLFILNHTHTMGWHWLRFKQLDAIAFEQQAAGPHVLPPAALLQGRILWAGPVVVGARQLLATSPRVGIRSR